MFPKVESWIELKELELRILNFWEEKKIFDKLRKKNASGPRWSFLDGPITANNPMGVHHAWGRVLKDCYQRYWAMNNYCLRYQNGFDCQGLWVEVEVEKELGFSSKKEIEKYGIGKFVEKCKERVRKYSQIQTLQSIRLGYWMDWDNSYYTMSDENNYAIWDFLKRCHRKKLIYKGEDVMPWCTRCGTGLSQHELHEGYREVKHPGVVVIFPLWEEEKTALLVWTTTPWTLTSNVAAAVHPEGEYVKVSQGKWNYYLARERLEAVLHKEPRSKILKALKGKELLSFSYRGPFDELPIQKELSGKHPLIPWREVTLQEGTGIVHIAPGCGKEDYELGKEFNLPCLAPLTEEGEFKPGLGNFTGKKVGESEKELLENLRRKGILYRVDEYTHSYPHCWRCGKELVFRLVDEWFIAMGPWREEIIKIAKKIRWIPSYGLDLEIDWLRNMRDWMISKKRYWGLALPIWECKECSFFEVIGSREELQKKATQGWEDFAGHSPHRPWVDMVKIRCEKCGKEISRIPDVGNPWLDAGIVPYSTTRYYTDREYWQKWIPADLVLECFPGQFRNWFYSLLAMSTMMENIPPFKTLLGHALVRDEKGEEMHKSKGNAIQIDEAIEKMGADVIRWLFCNHEVTTNLNFGYTPAREIRGKFFNTLWNTYSFFVNYARLIDFKPNEEELIERSDLDKWILSELQLLIKKARENFENLNVRGVCQASEVFLENLSNWYIRHSRRRFWRSELDKDTRAAYATLYQCLETLIRILAPIIPFVTEEIYQGLVRSTQKDAPESVHLTEFPRLNEQYLQPELSQEMRTLIRLTHLGLSAREKGKRKVRQPLSELIISPRDESEEKVVKKFERMLKESLNVKKVTLYPPKTPLPKDAPNLAIADEEETSVAVEITLNEELLIEGLMRDFLRRAQRLRKEIGLEIEDRIKVSYTTPSPKLKLMLERFREFILHELLCLELQEKAALTKAHLIKIGNEEIFLEIEKVNYWRKDNVDKN